MASRLDKYHTEKLESETTSYTSTRSDRNAKLYRQIYGKYNDLDNLPLDDNTDEIDMEKLKELVYSHNKKEEKALHENLNILEQRKRIIDEQRVYDINKILEKAKYENNKLKGNSSSYSKPDTSRLSLLESTELSLSDIKRASKEYSNSNDKTQFDEELVRMQEEKLSMTRELKYQNLVQDEPEERKSSNIDLSTKELSLDLFEDLKPTGNTITTKPIREEDIEIKQIEGNFRSSDTRDIDIIKNKEDTKENDFFTSSYHFSKNDFADDDFYDQEKKSGVFKILLLILAIIVFVGVIVYFVGTYGIGL